MKKRSALVATKRSKAVSKLYDKDFHPIDLVSHLEQGRWAAEICDAWGISRSTLDQWVEVFPEMKEAYSIGCQKFAAFNLRLFKETMFGDKKRKNVKGYLLMHYMKFAMNWNEQNSRQEHEQQSADDLRLIDLNDKNDKP